MTSSVRWHRVSDDRWVAYAELVGTLAVYREPRSYRWSMSALGENRSGFPSIGAAKKAAVRTVRDRLVRALLTLAELEKSPAGGETRDLPSTEPQRGIVLPFQTKRASESRTGTRN